ncbi:HflK protein, partial [gut metagenome]
RDDYSRDDEPEDIRPETPSRESRDDGHRAAAGGFGGIGGFGHLGGRRPSFPKKQSGAGVTFLVGLAVLAWAATGFYIVPEGQGGIVTTFGRYTETTPPGFRWHLPYPIQEAQIVDVSSVRTAEIGSIHRADRLREALMLTDDENIVDVQFTVQYRIKPGDGARDYVFRIRNPELTVTQVAESAMREVVGRKAMDSVLFEVRLRLPKRSSSRCSICSIDTLPGLK